MIIQEEKLLSMSAALRSPCLGALPLPLSVGEAAAEGAAVAERRGAAAAGRLLLHAGFLGLQPAVELLLQGGNHNHLAVRRESAPLLLWEGLHAVTSHLLRLFAVRRRESSTPS